MWGQIGSKWVRGGTVHTNSDLGRDGTGPNSQARRKNMGNGGWGLKSDGGAAILNTIYSERLSVHARCDIAWCSIHQGVSQ